MRISTNTIYQSGISKISNLQVAQNKLQQQISTGKRITTPSDDPIASARGLELSQAQQVNASYAAARQTSQLKLNTVESSLSSITNLLISVQSSLVGAGNATYSNLERGFIGSELSGSLEYLIGLANTQDAAGNFIYAGFKTDSKPFVANASGASYTGDSQQQLIQIDAQRLMATSVSGDAMFQAAGNDVFTTLSNIVTLLKTPITDPITQAAFNTGLTSAMTSLQSNVDNILNIRADVGAKLNELDALDTAGADRALQYSKSLSELEDLDFAVALSELSKQQIIMEAAQRSFVETTRLSLFQFI